MRGQAAARLGCPADILRVVDDASRESAERMRTRLACDPPAPAAFRAALTSIPPAERDAWLDVVLGLDGVPDDGPALPRGGVPYLPCGVDALLRMVEHAEVRASDVFVDIGAGVGRAAALVHLSSGASAIGIEIQPALVRVGRAVIARFPALRVALIEGDAAVLTRSIADGTVFFLYCPFSGARLETVLDDLEAIARTRQIRVCCVDLPLPPRPWLTLVSPAFEDLAVYSSAPVGR